MDVFTLGEVAEILGAPISRIKNWTIGRPLKIIPRVLAARGKGSRNLFSLEDVYLLAFVDQLYNDGISNSVIQVLVDGAFLTPKLGPVSHFALSRVGGKWRVKFTTGEFNYENVPRTRHRVAGQTRPSGAYVLNVKELIGWVNGRVVKLRGRV